jgi:hypothetical protein
MTDATKGTKLRDMTSCALRVKIEERMRVRYASFARESKGCHTLTIFHLEILPRATWERGTNPTALLLVRGAAGLPVDDGRADGRDFEHLEAELALGDFLQRHVHEGRAGIDDDQRPKPLAQLAHPARHDVDQHLRAVTDFQGVLDEGLFHEDGKVKLRTGSGEAGQYVPRLA